MLELPSVRISACSLLLVGGSVAHHLERLGGVLYYEFVYFAFTYFASLT
jgi:hypothetical protein